MSVDPFHLWQSDSIYRVSCFAHILVALSPELRLTKCNLTISKTGFKGQALSLLPECLSWPGCRVSQEDEGGWRRSEASMACL